MRKKYIILVFWVFSVVSAMAQQRMLAVTYLTELESEICVEVAGPGVDEALQRFIEANVPKTEHIKRYNLLIQQGAKSNFSLERESGHTELPSYQKSGNIELFEDPVGGYNIDDVPNLYLDLDKHEQLSQRNFFGKKLVVRESIRPMNWEIGSETKEILGKVCTKATIKFPDHSATDSETIYTAWFCKEIPAVFGPNGFYGLPGLILQIESVYDETITAIKIGYLSKKVPIEPPKGQVVSAEQFEKMFNEKLEELKSRSESDFSDWEIKH